MSTSYRYRAVAVLSALLFALACASTSPDPESDALEESTSIAQTSTSSGVAVRRESAALEPVYFDTDKAILRTDAREVLKRYAGSILDHPEWGVVTVDGHCDERGSDDYNQGLGRRRAAAVERYLLEMGVPSSRVAIRTFGADRPAVPGHGESAWSYNRRSEFQIEVLASTDF